MPQNGATEDENGRFPSWEGQGPTGPGVGWCWTRTKPTPALRATPPMEGISGEFFMPRCCGTFDENIPP
jgi:hypothetical protein